MAENANKLKTIFSSNFARLVGNKSNLQEIAEKIGTSRQTVSNWISGTFVPDAYALVKISKAYNVSVDYLLGLIDIESVDTDVKALSRYTSLTQNAIESLKNNKERSDALDNDSQGIVSTFLSSQYFYDAVDHIHKYAISNAVVQTLEQIHSYLIKTLSKQTSEEKQSKDTEAIVSAFREFAGRYTEHFYILNEHELYPTVFVGTTLNNAKNYRKFQRYTALQMLESIIESINRQFSDTNNSEEYIKEFLQIIESNPDIRTETKEKILEALSGNEGD